MSSDSSEEGFWLPYYKRDDWKDVTPIEQDDGPDPIVKIAYSDRFKDIYNYFRAIYASKEVSIRAYKLTKEAVEANPANYTAWHHLRYLIKNLMDKDDVPKEERPTIEGELQYLRDIMEDNYKNYQVWQHRRVLLEWLGHPGSELRFCEMMLAQDPKNYHAWQHRQWVITYFKLIDNELEFVERLINEDIRNNSAWNQRFFVLTHTAPNGEIKGDILDRELNYTMNAIKKVPGNESSWNYLRGLMDRCEEEENVRVQTAAWNLCEELYEKQNIRNPYLLGAMVDIIVKRLDTPEKGENAANDLAKVKELCQALASEHDMIRKEYWHFMERDIEKRFQSLIEAK